MIGKMTTQTKSVSVVTRTCDRPVLLARCFEHLIAALPDAAEWIIVNDSTDQAAAGALETQVSGFASRARFEIRVVNSQGGHRTRALNAGFDAAAGAYLHILDDDDTVRPAFYRETLGFLDAQENASWGAVAVRAERVDEVFASGTYEERCRRPHYPELEVISLSDMAATMMTPTCTLLFRRPVVADMRFDEVFAVGEDHDFLLRFLLKSDIALIDQVLCAYHQRIDGRGSDANSSISRNHKVEVARFRNALLRRDIAEGRVGLGWLVTMAEMNRGSTRLNQILSRIYRIGWINRVFQWFRG